MSFTLPGPRPTVLLVGGGIGGMAAALALARLGISIDLLEQSAEMGEIGAGLQLGPNAFAALDALGVGDAVRRESVFTERLVMMDAADCTEVASIPVGEAFRARFG
ncbi:MAG: FAD-dependent monooxygenase, partial [Variovorax sp.]